MKRKNLTTVEIVGGRLSESIKVQLKKRGTTTITEDSLQRYLPPVHYTERIYVHIIGPFRPGHLASKDMAGFSVISHPQAGIWVREHEHITYVLARVDEKSAIFYSLKSIFFGKAITFTTEGSLKDNLLGITEKVPMYKFHDKPLLVTVEQGFSLLNWPENIREVGLTASPISKKKRYVSNTNGKFTVSQFLALYKQGIRLFIDSDKILVRFDGKRLYLWTKYTKGIDRGKLTVLNSESFWRLFNLLDNPSLKTRIESILEVLQNEDFIEPPYNFSMGEAMHRMNIEWPLPKSRTAKKARRK